VLLSADALHAQDLQAIVGGTLIDGTDASAVTDAVILVRGELIECAGSRADCRIPARARRLEARGTWVIPGLIDAHVHFSQTGWFDGRPDAVDLRDDFPYPRVVAGLAASPERFFQSYLCAGVTSVFDVGGYPWTWALRQRFATSMGAPRIAAAGPLLATIDFWLNLPGQQQFIYMANDSVVRQAVRTHAAFKSDALKIWYIMPPHPPDTARVQVLVRAAADEARAYGLPLIVHATGLWEAKDAIRAGARVLVHSVFEALVDNEFVALARDHRVVYIPTLMVTEGYGEAATGVVDGSRYPLGCLDPVSASLARSGPPSVARVPAGFRKPELRELFEKQVANAMENAKRLHEAGVTIAVGTDAGNPGTFHGPSIYRELALLQAAGLSPRDVLVAATRNAALAMGRQEVVGTIEAGKAADLLVITADPTADIRNVQRIRWVMKGGVVVRP
jgi:imidazolonepropionase-like amidohydrolase